MTPAQERQRGPLLARVVSPDRFYGWYVAFACLVLMWVTIGVSYYGLSLFLRPLRDEHGWSNAVVSATGTFFVVSGIAGFVAGPSIDRIGARRFMAFGITLTALGAAAVGFVDQIWQLFAVYSVLAIAYGLGAVVPVSTLIARWFIRHRGKAMMISSTGVSLGGATLVPIGAVLIDQGGLRLAAPVLGGLVFLIAMPVLVLAIAGDPRDLGLEPDGGPAPANAPPIDHQAQFRIWSRAETLRTPSFWAVTTAFTLAVGATTGVLIHQLAFLQEPDKLQTRGAAALAVTTTTIGSIVARSLVGLVADRMDKRVGTAVLCALQALTIVGLLAAHGTFAIYVVALLFGFTVGNVYMFQSLVVGELFGLVSFGTVYGMVVLASQIGSGLALIAVGGLVDRHGYGVPFVVLAALDLVAAGAALLARPPAR